MSDLRAVLEDAESLLTATAGQAGERIQKARERAQETVRVARERLADTQEEVVQRAREAAKETDTHVRQPAAGRRHRCRGRIHLACSSAAAERG
jgi:ElaB/YqjD/DUF883 family membrane-anchored ribosome-binding protein